MDIPNLPKGKGKSKKKKRNNVQQLKALQAYDVAVSNAVRQQLSIAEGEKARIRAREVSNEQNRMRVKALASKLTAYDLAWIKQVMLPEAGRGGSAILTPAPTPARAQASHFRLEHIIENIADDTVVCVKPTLYPVSVSNQGTVTSSGFHMEGVINAQGYFEGEFYDVESVGGSDPGLNLEFVAFTGEFENQTAMRFVMTPGTVMEITQKGWPYGTYRTFFWDLVALAWVDMGTFDSRTGGGTVAFTVGSNAIGAVYIKGDADEYVSGAVYSMATFSDPITLEASRTHSPVALDIPQTSERYRITALAVKITFFGSTLNDEGAIAAARTYPGWTPYDTDDPWDAIASLPFANFDGRASQGIHAFWLPTDMKELDFRTYGSGAEFSSLDYTRIWCAMKGVDSTASMRIELDAIVEFYAPEPYYSKDPCPYLRDKYGEIYYLLGLAPCVGDNPGHLARIASIGKKVAKAVDTAAGVAAMFA